MKMQKQCWNEVKNHEHRSHRVALFAFVLFLLLIVGCSSPSQQVSQTSPTATIGCSDKDCFISAANDCKEISVTLTDDVGVFKYESSKNCVFTKTLVSVNDNETPEMKTLLQGKSLTCRYKKGNFDDRLVTSIIFGTEYCDGKLKDILGQLVLFA